MVLTADAVVVPGPERIVRALAAKDPAFEGLPAGGYLECALCEADLQNTRYFHDGRPPEPYSEPHAADCPWRLAREWVDTNPA